MKKISLLLILVAFIYSANAAEIDVSEIHKVIVSNVNDYIHAFLNIAGLLETTPKLTWNGTLESLVPNLQTALNSIGNLAIDISTFVRNVQQESKNKNKNNIYVPNGIIDNVIKTGHNVATALNDIAKSPAATIIATNLGEFRGANRTVILTPPLTSLLFNTMNNFIDGFEVLKKSITSFQHAITQLGDQSTDNSELGRFIFRNGAKTIDLIAFQFGNVERLILKTAHQIYKFLLQLPNGDLVLPADAFNRITKLSLYSIAESLNLAAGYLQLFDDEINSTASL